MICLDGVDFYDSVEELCENIDDVNIVFDLSEEGKYLEYVKRHAPSEVSVVGGEALIVFKKSAVDPVVLDGQACNLDRALGLFSTFVDQAEEEFWLLDTDGTVLDANAAVLESPRDLEFEGAEGTLINNVLLYAQQPDNAILKAVKTRKRADQVITKITSEETSNISEFQRIRL